MHQAPAAAAPAAPAAAAPAAPAAAAPAAPAAAAAAAAAPAAAARAAAPRFGYLLRLTGQRQGVSYETLFWQEQETKRVLLVTDVLASIMAILSALLTIYRLAAAVPQGRSVLAQQMGPARIFMLAVLSPLYLGTAAAPLVVVVLSRPAYFKHRLTMCLVNRLLRLVVSTLQLMTPAATAQYAKALSIRIEQEPPGKALAIILVHPAAFWMQQANFVLPWRWAALLQLLNFGAQAHWWSAYLPCWRQVHAATFAHALPGAARMCEQLQRLAALLHAGLGEPLYGALTPAHACAHDAAMVALQLISAAVCLLLVPLSVLWCLERTLKLRFVRRCSGPAAASGSSRSAPASSSSSSSNSSAGSASSTGGARSPGSASRSNANAGRLGSGASADLAVELVADGPSCAQTLAHLLLVRSAQLIVVFVLSWASCQHASQHWLAHLDCDAAFAAAARS